MLLLIAVIWIVGCAVVTVVNVEVSDEPEPPEVAQEPLAIPVKGIK
jgi:hypothetical protein